MLSNTTSKLEPIGSRGNKKFQSKISQERKKKNITVLENNQPKPKINLKEQKFPKPETMRPQVVLFVKVLPKQDPLPARIIQQVWKMRMISLMLKPWKD